MLGRFTLVRLLGHGSMGEVWAAHDQELDREVALKLLRLRSGQLGGEATARLRREAQAMARLNHPNVVTVYELGTDHEDRVFCAMELVDGVTLRRWLETPRSWRDVLGVASAVGRALAAAHAVGLIHRDIKPENVLIATDGRTLVSDFGLAKLVDLGTDADGADHAEPPAEIAPIATLTATGAMIGTPVYMSPEQLAGKPADARSDQFSYCVAVHEALFGARPFAGETLGELARDIRRGPPRPPHVRGVPRAVARCLARGFAADPAARWPSMTALLDELERAARRPRQRRIAALVGGAIAAAAAIAVGVAREPDPYDAAQIATEARIAAAWNPGRAAVLRARFLATGTPLAAERAATMARLLDAYRADWTTQRLDAWSATRLRGEQTPEILERRLACFDQLADAMGRLVGLFLSASVHDVDEAPQSVYRLEAIATCGNLARLLARPIAPSTPAGILAMRQLAELEAARTAGRPAEALQRANALVEPALQLGEPAIQARARFDLGTAQENGGSFVEAEATMRLALQEAAAVRDHHLVAECWLELLYLTGYSLLQLEAAAALEPAVRAAVAQAGDDPAQRADLAKKLGLIDFRRGDMAAARAHFAEARDRHIGALGADHPLVATDESNLGAVLRELGRGDEAVDHLERAIAIVERALGAHHPVIAQAEHNLASIAEDRKDWPEAVRHARAAVEMNVAVRGAGHPDTARNRIQLAEMLRHAGRIAEARSELELARATLERVLPANHAEIVVLGIHFAQLAEAEGHRDEAVQIARRAVERTRAAKVPNTYFVFVISELARMTADDAPGEALPLYDEALRLHVAEQGHSLHDDIDLLQQLADAAVRAHRPGAALAWFDRMPEAAAQLASLRRQLGGAPAGHR
ncbi:MAG: serine/threonine protein kinase [Deltaproteobacteria bacterium]|nr:MAG: serine/threonine protein kinase [Deltaproteobacteria bacterium]TMQ14759.1 MAG: serine/threonine protein kinase [Deltaproteobacteria bacterium]